MRIVLLTAGTGSYHCGTCMRDNALVMALRRMGHDAVLAPMYLPMVLDEPAASPDSPVFFGGINVYLQQVSRFFRRTPRWLDRMFDSPRMLDMAAKRAGMTRPSELGDLTISMLLGEEGNQKKEVERLVSWLKAEMRPDVVCLSNALLLGVARRIKNETGAAIVCTLQGEDSFLDSLPEPDRTRAWKTLEERGEDVDSFIAISRYYAGVIQERTRIPDSKMHVVYNGIDLMGYAAQTVDPNPPVIGFLAHMSPSKGLETLAKAYILLRARGNVKDARLHVAGSMNAADEAFVRRVRDRIDGAGLSEDVQFFPNLEKGEKQAFLQGVSVLSVPATYGEAFGLYLLEAWATGIPVVQPRHGAFPELIGETGGGVLCEPDDPESLAASLESVLLSPDKGRRMGEKARIAVLERFGVDEMARSVLKIFEESRGARPPQAGGLEHAAGGNR